LAEEIGIKLNSVTVDNKFVLPGKSTKLVVDASTSSAAGLADEANALYVAKDGSEVKEMELSLPLVNGKYESNISISDQSNLGEWKLSYVIVNDKDSNAQIFYNSVVNPGLGQDLSTADFLAADDNDAPKLEAISVDKTKVTQGKSVNITVKASDKGIGLAEEANLLYVLKLPKGEAEKEVTLKLKDGVYEGTLQTDDNFTSGEWQVSFIALKDNQENAAVVYNSKVHGDLGEDLSAGNFTVRQDEEAPVLKEVSVDRKNVKPGDTVKVKVVAEDERGLAKEANALYVFYTEKGIIEKEITLTLNGNAYEANITLDGSFLLVDAKLSFIALQDIVGNAGIVYNSKVNEGLGQDLSSGDFLLDLIAPIAPQIFLSTENPTNKDVEVTINTYEVNGKIEYKLSEGAEWSAYAGSFKVSDNTKVYARVTDQSGNVGATEIKEIKNIDKVAPVVAVTDVEDQGIYNKVVKPAVTVDDKEAVLTVTLNDKAYTGEEISAEGKYTLKAVAVDVAGNKTEVVKTFVIDKTAPSVVILGVDNNGIYNTVIKPIVTSDDKDAVLTVTINGNSYNGEDISAEGSYTLKVTAIDKALNNSETVIKFVIDKTAPVITITDVVDKAIYNNSVKPKVTVNDKEAVLTVTLNDKAYNGEEISAEGNYTLKAVAVDVAGNKIEVVKAFVIDKTAPSIVISEVANNGKYNTAVKPMINVGDKEAVITATLNDKPYNGEEISAEGSYVLKVIVVDKAGNKSETAINFAIDKTSPVVTVVGIEDSKDYVNTSVTPVITIDDLSANISVKLDNEPVSLSNEGSIIIKSIGKHSLVIKAEDQFGNAIEKVINFSLSISVTSDDKNTADAIKEAIKNTKSETPIIVDAVSNPVIDKDLLNALKGIDRPVTFVTESQGIKLQWTINGKDISEVTKDMDLTLNAVAPNEKSIAKIDGNAQIISFKYEGVLPAPMTVRIPVDSSKLDVTKPMFFYYYNPTTKKTELVGDKLTAVKVGDEYFVDVTITHCSDYFLTNQDDAKVTKTVETLAKTGSAVDMNLLVAIGALIAGIGAALMIGTKRRGLRKR
jgi:hypothetical protein